MRATNASSLPEICSAIATAQSFAETTAMHLSISATLICSPCARYTQLPPKLAARVLAVTVSASDMRPESTSSAMSSIVITFVTLAGKPRSCAFFSYSTSPVTFSISTADGADTLGTAPAGSAGAAQAAGDSSAAVAAKSKNRMEKRFILLPVPSQTSFCSRICRERLQYEPVYKIGRISTTKMNI